MSELVMFTASNDIGADEHREQVGGVPVRRDEPASERGRRWRYGSALQAARVLGAGRSRALGLNDSSGH